MKRLINWLDPYKQSFLFFKWNILTLLLVLIAAGWMTLHWKAPVVDTLLNNIFVYFPNYLTHEVLGHNLVGQFLYGVCYSTHPELGAWLATLCGNAVETFVPFFLLLTWLSIDGGRWLVAPTLYWLSTTFYAAGEYAADARACSMALTSSDMMTNYRPGEICGDWHHILKPLGWLQYDQIVACVFVFTGCLLFALAVYSAWYYWRHLDQYNLHPAGKFRQAKTQDDWTPPNIYTP